MRAIAKQNAEPGATLIDAPKPEATGDAVVVRVKATSICGTDYHIYSWDPWAASRIKPPMIFGHECAGEVVEVGPEVRRIGVGDRISAETHIPCRKCYQCLTGQMHLCQHLNILGVDVQGCFAEYVAVPEICCVKNDASLPWKLAAIQEPLGNAVYAVSESAVAGKSVAIFGDGPIGIFAAEVARAYGATAIIVCGMQPFRLNLIKSFGVDHVIDVRTTDPREAIMEITHGRGVDVVLEMSGAPKALHDGFAAVRRGGRFTFFGIPSRPVEIDLAEEVIFKGLTMHAINGRRMFETWFEVQNLLQSGRIDVARVVTHEFPLEKIDEAMKLLAAKEIRVGKIVLLP